MAKPVSDEFHWLLLEKAAGCVSEVRDETTDSSRKAVPSASSYYTSDPTTLLPSVFRCCLYISVFFVLLFLPLLFQPESGAGERDGAPQVKYNFSIVLSLLLERRPLPSV